ncbi:MAG: reverse transcriptase family protein [Granulosicoccus sp.]|nr:reverse transcriptase family protein [Granulosicoccus sp.]
MNTKGFFCRHLAIWFYEETWHFTTLLAIFIDVVENLPSDADLLVHETLLEFPDKTSAENIAAFLSRSQRVLHWFSDGADKPAIIRINLQQSPVVKLVNSKLPELNSIGDLAGWLGISIGQLDWLADLKRYDSSRPERFNHYHYRTTEKRDGRLRLIESPKRLLKSIQRQISDDILIYAPVHNAAHGFCKGRNCQSHASNHIGKNYLFLFDLAHCFQSVHWLQVFRVFTQLGYTRTIARYLTSLATHRAYSNHVLLDRLDVDQRIRLRQRHLPQGAPSSPALSNAVLSRLDKRLNGLAKSLRLDYSRYADDLAFSGNEHRDWRFLESLVGAICNEEGFALNYRKTRLVRPGQRQKITGVVVNQKTNIDRRYYDSLKAVLTNCLRNDLDSQNRFNHSDFRAHLRGRIQHVKSLNESKGTKLEKIFEQFP